MIQLQFTPVVILQEAACHVTSCKTSRRWNGGGPTYFNVTEQFMFHCKQRVGVQARNVEKGLLRGSLVNMM